MVIKFHSIESVTNKISDCFLKHPCYVSYIRLLNYAQLYQDLFREVILHTDAWFINVFGLTFGSCLKTTNSELRHARVTYSLPFGLCRQIDFNLS